MTDCILRPPTRGARGYPQMTIDGSNVREHRRLMEIKAGRKLSPDEKVIHLCHNKRCVNVQHLIIGTHAENMRMMVEAGRSPRGERNGSAKLTEADVRNIRSWHRYDCSLLSLAKLYGCTASNIKKIVARKSWKHVA